MPEPRVGVGDRPVRAKSQHRTRVEQVAHPECARRPFGTQALGSSRPSRPGAARRSGWAASRRSTPRRGIAAHQVVWVRPRPRDDGACRRRRDVGVEHEAHGRRRRSCGVATWKWVPSNARSRARAARGPARTSSAPRRGCRAPPARPCPSRSRPRRRTSPRRRARAVRGRRAAAATPPSPHRSFGRDPERDAQAHRQLLGAPRSRRRSIVAARRPSRARP